MFATRNVYIFTSYFLGLACLIFVSFTPITSQAGLFSAIAKLGKTAKTIDAPDVHLTPFRFADEIAGYPKGSVAEINYSYSQHQWMAKTPDGITVSIDEFATSAAKANQQPTLFISERDLPTSDHIFNRLPADINIKIKAKNGKTFELLTHDYPPSLLYQNIKVAVNDSMSLKTAIWQLQRPISTPKLRFVQFADNANTPLPSNVYGSKISIDKVGADQLLKSISKLRQETLVIAGKVENGVLIHGKQQVSIAELEKVAADRDVSLVILGADNPKKMLQQLVKEWQVLKDNNALLSYSTGDFYNTFAAKDVQSVLPIAIEPSGKSRTSLFFDHTSSTKQIQQQKFDTELVTLPIHLVTHSVRIYQANEERTHELDNRIHPAIDSSIHLALFASFIIGILTVHTAWFIFTKMWNSPSKERSTNSITYVLRYLFHRLVFLILYLPLLGFIGPIYLIIKWTYFLINWLLIRPTIWLVNKL